MYLFRGDVPVKEFARVMPAALRPGIRLAGKRVMGSYPYADLYMLEARTAIRAGDAQHQADPAGWYHQPRPPRDGAAARASISLAMGRALLREPDLVNKIMADPATRSRCTHNNKCMVTVFGRTHCVLDPQQRYGTLPLNTAENVTQSSR